MYSRSTKMYLLTSLIFLVFSPTSILVQSSSLKPCPPYTGQGISELSFNSTAILAEDVGSCAPTTGSNSHFSGAGLALIDGLMQDIFPIYGIIAGFINDIVSEMGSPDQYSDHWAICIKNMINKVLSRRPVPSTDQAIPSCFYFRIS